MRAISWADLLAQGERYTEAIPYLERARKVKPDFWAPYFYLGKARLKLEQPAEAVVLLQRAVALNPDEAICILPAWAGATGLRTRLRKRAARSGEWRSCELPRSVPRTREKSRARAEGRRRA